MNLAEPLLAPSRLARGLTFRDPGDIDSVSCWLESNRGVVLDSSGNVEQWRDQSGRGNHAAQATAAARPTYAADASGRMAIGTTIAARFLEIPSSVDLDAHATLGFTMYFVYSTSSSAVNCFPLGRWNASVPAHNWLLGINNGSTTAAGWYLSEVGTNSDRISVMGDGSTGATRVIACRYDPSGFVRSSLGGVAGTSTAIAGVKAGSVSTCIGRYIPGDVTLGMDGNVYAKIVVRRYIPFASAEDVFIRDYLARQYGAA